MTFEEILPFLKKGEKIRRDLNKNLYFYFKNQTLYNNLGNVYDFTYSELTANDWEVYEEPIDWNYIIEHKCLCWFWDNDEDAETKRIATFLYKKQDSTFIDIGGYCWRHCQPVKKPDFIFYEDKEGWIKIL